MYAHDVCNASSAFPGEESLVCQHCMLFRVTVGPGPRDGDVRWDPSGPSEGAGEQYLKFPKP